MTELEAQAKDYAMSRKLNLSEPTDITHVIGLLENAYIAGTKGVWHDLRKDPDDLPEDTYDVLDQAGYKVHYNFFQNVWVNEKDEIDEHVIAWCEIPTFDKE